jgi:16S rRNA (guanine527-N7)-methyltransferase
MNFSCTEGIAEKISRLMGEEISFEKISALEGYVLSLFEKNDAFNLIGPREFPQIWERHILDSAQLYPLLKNKNKSIADLGSGAGFPGLVLSILGIENITLIESSEKKSLFLENVSRETFCGAKVINDRVEKIKKIKFDIIISRAMGKLSLLLNFSEPISKNSTEYFFLKGKSYEEEISETQKKFNFSYEFIQSITDPESKIVHILKKPLLK